MGIPWWGEDTMGAGSRPTESFVSQLVVELGHEHGLGLGFFWWPLLLRRCSLFCDLWVESQRHFRNLGKAMCHSWHPCINPGKLPSSTPGHWESAPNLHLWSQALCLIEGALAKSPSVLRPWLSFQSLQPVKGTRQQCGPSRLQSQNV